MGLLSRRMVMSGVTQSISVQSSPMFARSVSTSETGIPPVSEYKTLESLEQLPETQTSVGYIVNGSVYVWVGEGGDALDGRYLIVGNSTLR